MTGLRPGEAKALKAKDLDPIRGRLMIRRDVDDLGRVDATKTRSHRVVPIGGELLIDLTEQAKNKDEESWLVPDEHGKVWTTARWRVIWKNLQIWTGITGIDTYELRHTAASLAIAAMTLDIYGHLWEEGLDTTPGAMEAYLNKERQRIAETSNLQSQTEAEKRRSQFRVL